MTPHAAEVCTCKVQGQRRKKPRPPPQLRETPDTHTHTHTPLRPRVRSHVPGWFGWNAGARWPPSGFPFIAVSAGSTDGPARSPKPRPAQQTRPRPLLACCNETTLGMGCESVHSVWTAAPRHCLNTQCASRWSTFGRRRRPRSFAAAVYSFAPPPQSQSCIVGPGRRVARHPECEVVRTEGGGAPAGGKSGQ